MPATVSGAVKAKVESLGLGLSCYRDAAPRLPGAQDEPLPELPYVSVREGIAATPDQDGAYDDDVAHTKAEQVQVDLWQRWRNPSTGKPEESYTLARDLELGLQGAQLVGLPFRVYGCRVLATARLLEPNDNVVHHVVTLMINREV